MTSQNQPMRRVMVVGGAGFIGGHFVDRLLGDVSIERVRVYDNFSSGREWHIAKHLDNPRFDISRGDVGNLELLSSAMGTFDTVIHLASNPDIAAAISNPLIDFNQGTLLTQNVLEAMRRANVMRIMYASGSGVYEDLGETEGNGTTSPMIPVSTYGASKLAGEALIASYCYMFGLVGRAFRFGNVVGPRQTHGVGYDFVRRLLQDPSELTILGDGQQSKSYIHVNDVISAVFVAAHRVEDPFAAFNVATGDYITVTEIAELAIATLGSSLDKTKLLYTGGDRGWRGDVPIVRLNTDKIRRLGWNNRFDTRQALQASLESMLVDFQSGQLA
jgi:UDP-glucose 4-epimerase